MLRDLVSTFLLQGLCLVANLLSGVLIARHLGPAGRGDWAAIFSTVSLIGTFSFLAAAYAIVYLRSRRRYSRADLAFASCAICLLGAALCTILAAGVARRLSAGAEPAFRLSLIVYAAGQFFPNFATCLAMLLRADREFGRANLAGLLPRLLVLGGYGALLAWRRFDLFAVVLVNVGASALLLGISGFWLRDSLRAPAPGWHRAAVEMARYGAKVWMGLLAQAVTLRADQIIIAALLPRSLLGLYAVSATVAELVGFSATAAGFVVGPLAAAADGRELARTVERGFRLTGSLVALSAAGLSLAGPVLIHGLYGARYDGAVVPFRWLVIAGVPMALFSLSKDVLVSRGQAALNTRIQLIGAAVTVPCCALLIRFDGLAGAGIASLLAYSCVAGLALGQVSRCTGAALRPMLLPMLADMTILRAYFRLLAGRLPGRLMTEVR